MTEGDVVLTPVPQADGTMKNRPAVFLREMPPFKDLLVCGISTQLRQEVKGFDELISPSDADFASSGLVRESLHQVGLSGSSAAKSGCRKNRFSFTGKTQAFAGKVKRVFGQVMPNNSMDVRAKQRLFLFTLSV